MAKQDSTVRTLVIIVSLCFVCALLVCLSVVILKPLQDKQIEVDRSKSILSAAGIEIVDNDVTKTYADRIEARLLELDTGMFVSAEKVKEITKGGTADAYDFQAASKLPESNYEIPADKDIAKIKRRAKYMPVYLVKSASGDGKYTSIILPFYGQGLWSTMYGYLSLSLDGNTIEGVKYYSHGETPGLGAEIENPNFTSKWAGKKLFDKNGVLQFAVLKKVEKPQHQVDAISGATLTSNGVSDSIKYWADANGYGPFLKKVKAEGVK